MARRVSTLGGRGSCVGVGGFGTGTGFFLTTIVGFGSVDATGDFLGTTFGSTITGSGTVALIIGAVDRGSPRRLRSTALSAYSFI